MAHSFVHYTCCLIVLTVCVDRGDGRWKKKDRENLQDDIELFRKMADEIQHEIEDSYDEISSKRLKEQIVNSLLEKYKTKTVNDINNKNITWENSIKSHDYSNFPKEISNIGQHNSAKLASKIMHANIASSTTNFRTAKANKASGSSWPKFDDILLEIGKRYDWKNDRWLKVKVKLKENKEDQSSYNTVAFHEKHNFHYKMIKLNRNKNRRNVVVAVSAVR